MAADWVEAHFGMERDFNLAVLVGIGRLSGTLFPTLDPSLRSSSVGRLAGPSIYVMFMYV